MVKLFYGLSWCVVSLLFCSTAYYAQAQSLTEQSFSSQAATSPVKPSFSVQYQFQGQPYQYHALIDGNEYIFNSDSENIVNIATLDWPPYVGRNLCNLGWSLQFAVAVLTAKNYRVNVYFYPWVRAVKMVESGQMEILYPEYFIEDTAPSDIFPNIKRRELLVQSNELVGGNISLFKHADSPFIFSGNLKSIEGKTIGVVRGYQNTPEFDAMMDKGLIQVIEAVDDSQLLKLLLGKRVDLIIGDPQVFHYVIESSDISADEQQALKDKIIEVSPALKYNHLYFAVSTKYAQWKQLLEDINLSLLEFESSGETQRIYQQGSGCFAK